MIPFRHAVPVAIFRQILDLMVENILHEILVALFLYVVRAVIEDCEMIDREADNTDHSSRECNLLPF